MLSEGHRESSVNIGGKMGNCQDEGLGNSLVWLPAVVTHSPDLIASLASLLGCDEYSWPEP